MNSLERLESLTVILTSQCNLRCRYCYQNAKKRRSMSWETLRTSLDLILESRHKKVSITFMGGEPLLEFPLLRRGIEYAERARSPRTRVTYSVSTNGTLLTERIVAFLAKHHVKAQLSIDGVDDAQNLRAPGTFPLIDRLLDRLRTRHRAFYERDCTIAIIATPLNIRYLADSVDYLLDKGARRISIAPSIVSDPRWRLERIGELEAQFERILASSVSYLRETGRVPVQLLQGEAESPSAARRNRPMCGLVHGRGVTVDVDGEAYGCRLFAESYQRIPSRSMERRLRGMRMGGIDDPDFARRFASFSGAVREAGIFHRKEEKRSAYGLCRSCRFFAHCSICPACIARAAGNRDPNRVSDFCCAFNMVALGCRERFSGLRGPRRISLAPPGAVALRDWWKALAGGAVQTQQPRRARRTEAP